MKKLDLNKPLRAKAVYLKGYTKALQDKVVYIAGNFLIVAKDENDTAPTWFNVDQVTRLEGVTQIEDPPRITRTVFL